MCMSAPCGGSTHDTAVNRNYQNTSHILLLLLDFSDVIATMFASVNITGILCRVILNCSTSDYATSPGFQWDFIAGSLWHREQSADRSLFPRVSWFSLPMNMPAVSSPMTTYWQCVYTPWPSYGSHDRWHPPTKHKQAIWKRSPQYWAFLWGTTIPPIRGR